MPLYIYSLLTNWASTDMATQQEKKKPVSSKKTAISAKLVANLQLEANPADKLLDVEERRTRLVEWQPAELVFGLRV